MNNNMKICNFNDIDEFCKDNYFIEIKAGELETNNVFYGLAGIINNEGNVELVARSYSIFKIINISDDHPLNDVLTNELCSYMPVQHADNIIYFTNGFSFNSLIRYRTNMLYELKWYLPPDFINHRLLVIIDTNEEFKAAMLYYKKNQYMNCYQLSKDYREYVEMMRINNNI